MANLTATIAENLPYLLTGAITTIAISLAAIVLGALGAMTLNFAQIHHRSLQSRLARIYISVFRGTPFLVQLLVIFYLPNAIGMNISPLATAIITMALNTSAFQAEIYRGGFASLPVGQIEAARATGMNALTTFVHIQIPQVIRLVLPALTNEFILLLKASSLVSVVAVRELTTSGRQVVAATHEPVAFYLIIAAIYIAINTVLSKGGRELELQLRH